MWKQISSLKTTFGSFVFNETNCDLIWLDAKFQMASRWKTSFSAGAISRLWVWMTRSTCLSIRSLKQRPKSALEITPPVKLIAAKTIQLSPPRFQLFSWLALFATLAGMNNLDEFTACFRFVLNNPHETELECDWTHFYRRHIFAQNYSTQN